LLDGPLWGRMLLVALSVPLAMLGNILRVASLLFVARDYGAEAAFVYYHDYSGPVFFVLMLILLLPLAWLLRCRNLRTEVI
jgi:exosortase/archaeosortase family protein